MSDDLDISSVLTYDEGLPRPQWDLIQSWVETRGDPDQQYEAWAVVRQWLKHLAARERLKCGLSDPAGRFLGQGSWEPSL